MIISVIDKLLWERIKKQYPDKVETRLKGISGTVDDELFHQDISHQIAGEGEIKKAFEEQIQNFEVENREQRYIIEIKQLFQQMIKLIPDSYLYTFIQYFHSSEKERRKSQALILKIQREELARRSNIIQPKLPENVEFQNSPDFHGWETNDGDVKKTLSDNVLLSEFLDRQKETEEIIFREKQDAELAKQIQDQTDSPVQSTSYHLPNIKNTEKPKVAHELFVELTDDSVSDIEDTQDIYDLPDLEPTKNICDNTKKYHNICFDKLSMNDYKNLDLNDFIDNQFINHQSEQLRKLNQEKEDERLAKELQRKFQEEDRMPLAMNNHVQTRNSPLHSKNMKQNPSSAKRQLSIEQYMCQDYRKKAKR